MKKTRKKTAGFTLAEVIVAMAVVVIGILPLSLLFVSSRHLSDQAQIQSAAYNVAREEMETLRAQNFKDRTVGTTTAFTIPSNISSEFPTASMTGSYLISSYSTDPNGVYNTQQIVVRVSWTNMENQKGTSFVQLDTI